MYVRVVNVLPMEEYLRGVIPSEMIPGWHAEALKVQAVAARRTGETGLVASDIAEVGLPRVFRRWGR